MRIKCQEKVKHPCQPAPNQIHCVGVDKECPAHDKEGEKDASKLEVQQRRDGVRDTGRGDS